jgi:hypothetical protein
MSNPASSIPLPKSWPAKVRSAMLHVVSLAKYAAVYTRSWAADCPKVRLRSERMDSKKTMRCCARSCAAHQRRPHGQHSRPPADAWLG